MTLSDADLLLPDWPAHAAVRAIVTTRAGGVSPPPYDSLNLGIAVGDDPESVRENRARLRARLPAEPRWLRQVHGNRVVDAATVTTLVEADGSFTTQPGVVCVVQMADCMPVLLADHAGTRVAAAHAGWRGLSGDILGNAVRALDTDPAALIAWMGPAIGPTAFEVGDDVRDAYVGHAEEAAAAFVPHGPGKWLADLFVLARQRLASLAVGSIHGGGLCTVGDSRRFFSHRRDRVSGRMAAAIWLAR
jgi:YfiH family protein